MGCWERLGNFRLRFLLFSAVLSAVSFGAKSKKKSCDDLIAESSTISTEVSTWKALFKENHAQAFEVLPTLRLNPTQLFQALSYAAPQDAQRTLSFAQGNGLPSSVQFHLYRRAAEKLPAGDGIIPSLIANSALTEEQKTEIFCIRWDLNHGNSDEHVDFFERYAFESRYAFFNILRRYAEADPQGFLNEFDDDVERLPEEQKVEIGRVLAKETSLDEGPWINRLHLSNPASRSTVLAFAVTRMVNDWGWQDDYLNDFNPRRANWFEVSPQDTEAAVAYVFQNVRKDKLKHQERRQQFLSEWLGTLTREQSARLWRVLFTRIPVQAIAENMGVADSGSLPLVAEDGQSSLSGMVESFANANPTLLRPGVTKILNDVAQDRDIFVRLLEGYIKLGGVDAPVATSGEIISRLTGLDVQRLQNSHWHTPVAQVYKIWLDLSDHFASPPFEGVVIGEEVWRSAPELLRFATSLRDYLSVSQRATPWVQLRVRFFSAGITLDSIRQATDWLKQEIVTEVQAVLARSSVTVSSEDLERLSQSWGDLEPIYTLIARFSSKKEWKKEIDVMGRVLAAGIRGTFRQFKYLGEGENEERRQMAAGQLRSLSPELIATWAKSRAKAELVAVKKAETASAVPDSQELLAQVAPFLEEVIGGGERESDEEEHFIDDILGNKILRGNPDKIIRAALEKTSHDQLWRWSAKTLLSQRGASKTQGAVRALRVLLRAAPVSIAPEAREPLSNLLRALEKATSQKSSGGGASILLSVMSGDAKYLMTVGDLVQTSSCVNYRTGGKIGALLGYVVDANVQLLSTFILKQDDFNSFDDYRSVLASMESGRGPPEISWDGNRRIATFQIGSESVSTKSLGYAYLRQMIKVGQTARGTGVRLEKEYLQDHPALTQMRQVHRQILLELARELGASTSGAPVTFAPTRNPGGIYSDLADDRGTQQGAYTIH